MRSFLSMKSFMGSALPVHIAMKSASESSRVHCAGAAPPLVTVAVFVSTVHVESGLVSLNW